MARMGKRVRERESERDKGKSEEIKMRCFFYKKTTKKIQSPMSDKTFYMKPESLSFSSLRYSLPQLLIASPAMHPIQSLPIYLYLFVSIQNNK